MTDSLSGHLLVASSLVTDPIIAAGVCLVMHQDDSRTIGVMLNRPLRPSPEALLNLLDGSQTSSNRLTGRNDGSDEPSNSPEPAAQELTSQVGAGATGGSLTSAPSGAGPGSSLRMIHFGGPLSGPVLAIHQASEFAEAETGDGIYVAAQKHYLENLVRQQQIPYRLIVGHLGWRNEQLEEEIEAGVWHILPATVEAVFSPSDEMWPSVIRRATSRSLARWIGVPDQTRAYELN